MCKSRGSPSPDLNIILLFIWVAISQVKQFLHPMDVSKHDALIRFHQVSSIYLCSRSKPSILSSAWHAQVLQSRSVDSHPIPPALFFSHAWLLELHFQSCLTLSFCLFKVPSITSSLNYSDLELIHQHSQLRLSHSTSWSLSMVMWPSFCPFTMADPMRSSHTISPRIGII